VASRTAILFWFYKDLPVCRNRLDLLRRDNPETAIFGLFGGDVGEADQFRDALMPQLDDFYVFERDTSSKWKWLNGDLMLAAWYEERGHRYEWDHVFVAQWDMLVLQNVDELVPFLGPDDVLLSGALPVAAVEPRWVWSKGGHEAEYRAFLAGVHSEFGDVEPMSCVFIVACLPRRLLAAYTQLSSPETGYVEYRLPTLARAIRLHFVDDDRFSAWRPADGASGRPTRRQRFINGSRRPILLPSVLAELARRDGARVFHPYHGLFPANAKWAVRAPGWGAYAAARTLAGAVRARVGHN
jgi:hypothetical protein